jgi:hypothetical protein
MTAQLLRLSNESRHEYFEEMDRSFQVASTMVDRKKEFALWMNTVILNTISRLRRGLLDPSEAISSYDFSLQWYRKTTKPSMYGVYALVRIEAAHSKTSFCCCLEPRLIFSLFCALDADH